MTITLSRDTLTAFADQTRLAWAKRSAAQLHETWGKYYAALDVSAEALVPLCVAIERLGVRYDVRGERELFRLVLVAAGMGHRFWKDPRFHGYVSTSLGDQNLVPSRRAIAMAQHTRSWLDLIWKGDSLTEFSRRLSDELEVNSGSDAVRNVLPQHWLIFSDGDTQRLIGWLLETMPEDQFREPPQQLAYLAMSLVHGVHWATDRQYHKLSSIIRETENGSELGVALASVYEQMT